MQALIVVDVQNDFMPYGSLPVADGDAVVLVANKLMPSFDLVVATQDWHPASHGSFAANHPGKEPGDIVDLGGVGQVLWPPHCVRGTEGAEFHPDLDTDGIDHIVHKGTDPRIDSYSAFFDNGQLRSTGLEDFLRGSSAEDLFFVGLATDYCVRFSVLDGIELGFKCTVIEDGVRGVNLEPGDDKRALEEMRSVGAAIVRSKAVLGEW